MSESRIVFYWLNSAKGMGVVLILAGHLLFGSSHAIALRWIYSFHVPMFFICSGYVCNKGIDAAMLRHRTKRLGAAYISYVVLWMPIYAMYLIQGRATVVGTFIDATYLVGRVSNEPLWFLVALLEVELLLFILGGFMASKKSGTLYGCNGV